MLVLRLSRTGRKKLPHYRLVAADSRRPVKGKVVAQLGHYNPHVKDFVFDKEKVEDYIKKGAQPSSAVVKLLKKEKISLPKWAEANLVVKKKAPKKKEEKTEAKPAAPSAEAKADAAKSEEKPAKEDAKAEEKPAAGDADTEAKAEDKPAEAKKEDKPAETPPEDKAAEPATKPEQKS